MCQCLIIYKGLIMELNKLEMTIINDAKIDVDNWKWKKWVQLLITLSAVVAYFLDAFDVIQISLVDVIPIIFMSSYIGDIFRSWNGLKKESLLIKCFEFTQKNSK